MNKTLFKIIGIVAIILGAVAFYLSGTSESSAVAIVGAVFVLAGIIAAILTPPVDPASEPGKAKTFFALVGKFFVDLVTNIKGQGDPHKIAGYAILAVDLGSALRPGSTLSVAMFGSIAGVALVLLGFSAVGDNQALKSGDPSRYQ